VGQEREHKVSWALFSKLWKGKNDEKVSKLDKKIQRKREVRTKNQHTHEWVSNQKKEKHGYSWV